MAIRMNITPNDVKSGKLVRAGWYNVRVENVKQELASDKTSHNTRIDVIGLDGDAAGVPVPTWFNEKFAQGAIPFVRATGGKVTEEDGLDPDYDFEVQVGKTVMAHIVTSRGKTGNDKPRNQIDDWAPASSVNSSSQVAEVASFEDLS